MPSTGPDADAARLTSAMLSEVRRVTAFDSVRIRVAMAVDLGLLRPDDRLPDTDSIAAAFDVSEITVRRALVALAKEGVLTRQRGRSGGTFVASRPAHRVVAEIGAYHAAAAAVHRLIDQRLVVESGVVALAARTVDESDVSELQRLVDAMDVARTWADFHSLDERFHLAVADATDTPSAGAQLRVALHELYRFYLPYPLEYLRTSNAEHRLLVEALRGHDVPAALEVTHRHIACLHETMFVGLLRPGPSGQSDDN